MDNYSVLVDVCSSCEGEGALTYDIPGGPFCAECATEARVEELERLVEDLTTRVWNLERP